MPKESIVVVEDDGTLSQVIQSTLVRSGYHVRGAGTVSMGLALALEHAPVLLVLDIELPDGNGWDLLEMVRGSLGGDHVPVIVISSTRVTRSQLRRHRVDRFIPKPFHMLRLVETVDELLSQSIPGDTGCQEW